jgi:hypothetical protein
MNNINTRCSKAAEIFIYHESSLNSVFMLLVILATNNHTTLKIFLQLQYQYKLIHNIVHLLVLILYSFHYDTEYES